MSSSKTQTITLEKELYSKNAVLLTVFEYVDIVPIHISSTDTEYVLRFQKTESFDKDQFIKDLTVNVAKEIVEERTALSRDALYMASIIKGLTM